jgi:hypothetical protein
MRRPALLFFAACLGFAANVPQAFGQSVVSVRSGLINYSEGDVLINGQPLQRRFGAYTSLKAGSDLVTRSGRAELLLTPNAYLRVGAESAIRMVSDGLADTRVELLGGSAVLDSSTAPGKTPLTITLHDSTVRFLAPGRFRVDSDPPQLRVFEGDAEVEEGGKKIQVAPSQLLPLSGAPIVRRFTDGSDNMLDLWSDERSSLIASNLNDAQNIGDPLTDPDPDPTLAGTFPYPGYIPMLNYPAAIGGGYGGYSTLAYPNGIYPSYSPYGVYSPYGIYGTAGIYSPLYLNALRRGVVVNSPSGLIGLRPGSSINSGTIHTFSPRPVITSHPVTAPHTAAPHVGAHR